MSQTGIECEVTDGLFDKDDPECNRCEKTCREICKLFAVRGGMIEEEDFLVSDEHLTKMARRLFGESQ